MYVIVWSNNNIVWHQSWYFVGCKCILNWLMKYFHYASCVNHALSFLELNLILRKSKLNRTQLFVIYHRCCRWKSQLEIEHKNKTKDHSHSNWMIIEFRIHIFPSTRWRCLGFSNWLSFNAKSTRKCHNSFCAVIIYNQFSLKQIHWLQEK